jgi:hypothetical protein
LFRGSLTKTNKKTDNNICKALTVVCETIKDQPVAGFSWLTHTVNYAQFPSSLVITLVFDNDNNQAMALDSGFEKHCLRLIQTQLLKVGVKFLHNKHNLKFTSEESSNP